MNAWGFPVSNRPRQSTAAYGVLHMRPIRALHVTSLIIALLVVGLVAGCASVTGPATAAGGKLLPAPPLAEQGARRYHVLRADSQLRIRVYRTGPLADLGHNHIISTSNIRGVVYVQPKIEHSGFELRIPLKSLVVDNAAQRAEEGSGFRGEPSAADRAGTRAHMLGSAGFDVAKYPEMVLRSLGMVGPPWYPRIRVRVTLHGVSHDYTVPTALFHGPHRRLVAIGGLSLKQSDFGMTPYSILNGALRVRDTVDVSFHLVLVPGEN